MEPLEKNEEVILVGAGDMAIEYAKVLDAMKINYKIIGRGEESAKRCEEISKHGVVRGGIENYIHSIETIPRFAIVTVYPLSLKTVTLSLLEAGVKNILVEKPAGMNLEELSAVSECAKENKANVFVAYNRRFYASVQHARKMISEDGGVTSFNFEFTEWSHKIEGLPKPKEELENWFMANSTHVIDLAFFLGGKPREISTYVCGSLPWYSKASAFAGAGITEENAVFSYKANWESAGRWSVEVLTKKHKFLFEPLEQLKLQNRGEIQVTQVVLDDELDRRFKAGLYKQVEAFFDANYADMIDIHEHKKIAEFYDQMERTGQLTK